MLKIISILILVLFIATPQSARNHSVSKEDLSYLILVGEVFKEVGGVNTFRLILALNESTQEEKDIDLIFKAANINKEKALTAFSCFATVTELINAGIESTNAVRITKKARDNGVNIKSAPNVLIHAINSHAHTLEKKDKIINLVQATEALRQAKILFHMKLKTKIAFEENGIDIDLIQKEPKSEFREKLIRGNFLTRKKDN